MRIDRLDLHAYGRFTNHVVDFGARPLEGPDLHVIYGPNEAGKSTLFNAVLDLFHGIETRSSYGFLHAYDTMRIGGALNFDGRAREFVRVKKQQGSLRDGSGAPVGETALQAALAGLNREACRTMFSLNDETLKEGGESILASKGDLGHLLFSASAGLADMTRTLETLKKRLTDFHQKNSPKSQLAQAKAQLEDLRRERRDIDVSASAFEALLAERDRSQAAYASAVVELASVEARRKRVADLLGALPLAAKRQGLLAELQGLQAMVAVPESWIQRWPGLRDADIRIRERRAALAASIAARAGAAEVELDGPALAQEARLQHLVAQRALHQKNRNDLPNRIDERNEATAKVEELLARLGREEETYPRTLLLSAAVEAELSDLVVRRSGLDAALAAAREALAIAEAARDAAEAAGQGQPSVPPLALQELKTTLAATRADDHAVRAKNARQRLMTATDSFAEACEKLHPWDGDAEALARMTVPAAADVSALGAAIGEARAQARQREEAFQAAETAWLGQKAALAATADATLADGADHAAIRAMRDALWNAHRQTLDNASAEAFAQGMRRDDAATAALLTQATDVARLTQLRLTVATAEQARDRAKVLHDAARESHAAAEAELAGMIAAVSTALIVRSADALLIWLRHRDAALTHRREIKAAERDLAAALADGAALAQRLRTALEGAGVAVPQDQPIPALMALGDSVLAEAAKAEALQGSRETIARDIQDRERELVRAQAAMTAWDERWNTLCGGCWLGSGGRMPEPSAVSAILKVLTQLDAALQTRAFLSDRHDKLERELAQYRADVEALAETLGIDAETDEPLQALHLAEQRVTAARKLADARARAKAELAQVQADEAALMAEASLHDRQMAELMDALSVQTREAIDTAMTAYAKRRQLSAGLAETEAQLTALLGVPTLTEVEARLTDADMAALQQEQQALSLQATDLDRARMELFAQKTAAEQKLEAVGGDSRVAMIEESRATILTELKEKAQEHLRLQLGIAAIERALATYREEHRSTMMEAASEAFRLVSRGNYRGLVAQAEGGNDVLVAVAGDGATKQAKAMSTATRAQLYLALRVAGHRDFATQHTPLPFICDDILETFDDFRAEEAFRLLGRMAERGQVIYLTHHRHLCDTARDICPGVTVHTLPDPAFIP